MGKRQIGELEPSELVLVHFNIRPGGRTDARAGLWNTPYQRRYSHTRPARDINDDFYSEPQIRQIQNRYSR